MAKKVDWFKDFDSGRELHLCAETNRLYRSRKLKILRGWKLGDRYAWTQAEEWKKLPGAVKRKNKFSWMDVLLSYCDLFSHCRFILDTAFRNSSKLCVLVSAWFWGHLWQQQ